MISDMFHTVQMYVWWEQLTCCCQSDDKLPLEMYCANTTAKSAVCLSVHKPNLHRSPDLLIYIYIDVITLPPLLVRNGVTKHYFLSCTKGVESSRRVCFNGFMSPQHD